MTSSIGNSSGALGHIQTPPTPASEKPKRPRPVLSCLTCRRKKLKCDRSLPCNQCQKSGISPACSFQSKAATPGASLSDHSREPDTNPRRKIARVGLDGDITTSNQYGSPLPSRHDVQSANLCSKVTDDVKDLAARVRHLEQELERLHGGYSDSTFASTRTVRGVWPRGILKVKGSRSRYYSANHKLVLVRQFDEVLDFIQNDLVSNSDMTEIMRELRYFQKMFKTKEQDIVRSLDLPPFGNTSFSLLEMLPSRSICDELIEAYLATFEKTMRVLHVPTFLDEYENFWSAQDRLDPKFEGFLAELTAIAALGSIINNTPSVLIEGTQTTLSYHMQIQCVENWLHSLNDKRRLLMSTMRTHCLMLCAKRMVSKDLTHLWSDSGSLVRCALAMGLQRDPTESPDISIFHAEQRRRLWASIMEMDFQLSIVCGMPTMIQTTIFTCALPQNLDDRDIYEDMVDKPTPKPMTEKTDSTAHILLAKSLPLRLEALQVANNISEESDYGRILRLGRGIEDLLQHLPNTLRADLFVGNTNKSPGVLFDDITSDIYLRRVLVSLYRPFVLRASHDGGYEEARRACVRCCLVILSHGDLFDPATSTFSLIDAKKYWDLFHRLWATDIYQAALTICVDLRTTSMSPSSLELTNNISEGQIFNSSPEMVKTALVSTVDSLLSNLLRRVGESGIDIRDCLCLSLVLNSVRPSSSSSDKKAMLRHAADRVIEACRQITANYEDTILDETEQGTSIDTASTTGNAPIFAEAPGFENDLLGMRFFAGLDFSPDCDLDFGGAPDPEMHTFDAWWA